MNIVNPSWTLNQFCPVCEQGSCLIFYTCDKCREIVLICLEEGTLFPNPKDLTEKLFETDNCPFCQALDVFDYSTSEEIQKLGFKVGEYI